MKKFIGREDAQEKLGLLSENFTVIKNPDYVYPEYEIVPVAPRLTGKLDDVVALVMDMDGTTTTTEELCIHSLEYMVRKMSGKMTQKEWAGLDSVKDYPNIIGNSTTKHVEYLILEYGNEFSTENIIDAWLTAAANTLKNGRDTKRKEEVAINSAYFDCSVTNLQAKNFEHEKTKLISRVMEADTNDLVRLGIDIYYHRYHEILGRIKNGESRDISQELFGNPNHHLIEPMQGISLLLPLVKGWLGKEAKYCAEILLADYEKKSGKKSDFSKEETEILLEELGLYFEKNPAKVAVVTSSIFYEADIVLQEVFNLIHHEIERMPVYSSTVSLIQSNLITYRKYYDAVVTASDSSEIRLKPHRDLYSLALHQLGVKKADFDKVAGFEDSESGTIAIRAAGIGCCVAVPFAETSGHNLEAASHICNGGIPEAILNHKLFLKG